MIRLFGAFHGLNYNCNSTGRSIEAIVNPSNEILNQIGQLPKGSNVGIEGFSVADRVEIYSYARKLTSEVDFKFSQPSTHYFDSIAHHCSRLGHNVVWLDDKDAVLRFYSAQLEVLKLDLEFRNFYMEEGETDEKYHTRLITRNEKLQKAKIIKEIIFILERDTGILGNIAINDLDIVVSGVGHTDSWILNQERLRAEYGIEFGQYSQDQLTSTVDISLEVTCNFVKNATPDSHLAYDFKALTKQKKLLETGQYTDKTPDWVGTWDVYFPSYGYFELFIENEENGQVQGRIEDGIGTARFEGIITPRHINFTKLYGDCKRIALKSELTFKSVKSDYDRDAHHGRYNGVGASGVFYMEKFKGKTPLEIALSWYHLSERDEPLQKSLL